MEYSFFVTAQPLLTGLRSGKFLPKEPDFAEIKVFFIAKNAKD